MGTQGPGRRRIPNRDKLSAEDDALDRIAREAEARLALKRAARAEARDIRMKELERRQKEVSDDEEKMSVGSRGSFRVEEKPDRDFLDKGCRTASTLSAATLTSLGGASSRRGSCDTSFSVETEASIREIKDSLVEADERYRRAMVSNAQLHNDKSSLMYQVETLREELSDMEEELWESRRHRDHASKEFERERQTHSFLQFQYKDMKEALRQTEELLTVGNTTDTRQTHDRHMSDTCQTHVLQLLTTFDSLTVVHPSFCCFSIYSSIDLLLYWFIDAPPPRQLSELKFKLVKSEQEVAAMEQNIVRLDGQVTRYKSASENAEKVEDELKVEKRKLQREESLRSALDRVDELEVSKGHLTKRLEKMKANRNALLAQH
uniref:Leucine-rich repeat flightless-interacting protein 2-like n=1 Tax=Scophthalmus maximus TaxID=52904 RepID=A0A8D3E9Q1_SCOMX